MFGTENASQPQAPAQPAPTQQAPVQQAPVQQPVQTQQIPEQFQSPSQPSPQQFAAQQQAREQAQQQAQQQQQQTPPPAAQPGAEQQGQPPAGQEPADPMKLQQAPAYKHEPTGNAAYDVAMTAFAEKGFNPDHPAFLPATKGDFTALEAWAKQAGVDGAFVALAKQAHAQISQHHAETHGATIKQAYEIAGGEERWGKVKSWVEQNAEPGELKEWAVELEAGGKRTLAAVTYLSQLYGAHGENVPTGHPASPVRSDSSPNVATTGAPLSPQEFRQALGQLIEKVGYSSLESSAEYKALQQRRLAWRG